MNISKILPGLNREQTIAPNGYNRWVTAISALAIHLSLGQVYAMGVFNAPMTKLIGITTSASDDWNLATLGWIFSSAIAFLGISAAVFGNWVVAEGPRKAMFVATICWSSGFLIGALGIYSHQIALLYLGYGVLGGIGLGIGYISPVTTLIQWFPDYPGMATGIAIMGFGGGPIVAAPLATNLMKNFAWRLADLCHDGCNLLLCHDVRAESDSGTSPGLATERFRSILITLRATSDR
jgi:MFS family permease